jgi:cytochrome c556
MVLVRALIDQESEASVNGDLKGPLAALQTLTQNCVACHAAYRLH